MKEKILTAIVCICVTSCVLAWVGCRENYPSIEIHHEAPFEDTTRIDVGNKYEFDKYEKSETADGCVVLIYFKGSKINQGD